MATRIDLIDISDIEYEIIRKRNECNITQVELAKIMNTSNASISSIENKKRRATVNYIEKIFNSMGYKVQIAITIQK